jgi:hypothetical protein
VTCSLLVVSFTNKTDHHDIAEIFLKIALSNCDPQTIKLHCTGLCFAFFFFMQVREKCHIPKTDSSIQSGKALSQLLRSQLNPHRDRRAIGGDYLYDKIRLLMQELLTSMNMFNTVSDDICGQEILYDEDEQSSTCWNGTSVGR